MAEYHFYGAQEDTLRVLAKILEDGAYWLIPSTNYLEKKVKAHTAMSPDLLHALSINRRLYIGGFFSRQPVCFMKLDGGKCAGTYVVDQKRGGPLLSVSLPMCKKLDEKIWHLGPGDLFCPPYFWDDAAHKGIAPSPETKKVYAHLKKLIKGTLRQATIGKPVWIGEAGLSLLEQRQALILMNGQWVTISGEFVKSNLNKPINRPRIEK